MTYSVKEVFYTLQGEGENTGGPAVFCRFPGCNLWSGLERVRSTVVRQFCDTDFVETDGVVDDEIRTAEALADHVAVTWPQLDHSYLKVIEGLDRPTLEI